MIKKLTLKNFKSIKDQTYEFTEFDLLVGRNNSGKSTILQAMAIWQYCVDEFRRSDRKSKSIQIVLPNFTALPVPEFNLLWTERTDREYNLKNGKKTQEYIYIEIQLTWLSHQGKEESFGVRLRYQSPQAAYASPKDEKWDHFKELDKNNLFPRIVYVPPFSGLEPNEEWRDDSILKRQVGKAQPGSVLRNLLFRVIDKSEKDGKGNLIPVKPMDILAWQEITNKIRDWFGIELNPPRYEKGVSTQIECTYKSSRGKEYDIISGGSGFHQTLTLLAFFYGYEGVTTILFDEPDAHLHVNLQREVLNYFTNRKKVQFIIATHAEEFIRGVAARNILSVLKNKFERVTYATSKIITALAEVNNIDIVQTQQSPYILYLEGEDDERILRKWASVLGRTEIFERYHIYILGGTNKKVMKESADKHFEGLGVIVGKIKRMTVFDYDEENSDYHPNVHNKVEFEWKRKNIDNYLLVEDAWIRAAMNKLEENRADDPVKTKVHSLISTFFRSESLMLPEGQSWRTIKAQAFSTVDGKKLLYENTNSLFRLLRQEQGLELIRETIAGNMLAEELHQDIVDLFDRL